MVGRRQRFAIPLTVTVDQGLDVPDFMTWTLPPLTRISWMSDHGRRPFPVVATPVRETERVPKSIVHGCWWYGTAGDHVSLPTASA